MTPLGKVKRYLNELNKNKGVIMANYKYVVLEKQPAIGDLVRNNFDGGKIRRVVAIEQRTFMENIRQVDHNNPDPWAPTIVVGKRKRTMLMLEIAPVPELPVKLPATKTRWVRYDWWTPVVYYPNLTPEQKQLYWKKRAAKAKIERLQNNLYKQAYKEVRGGNGKIGYHEVKNKLTKELEKTTYYRKAVAQCDKLVRQWVNVK